MKVSTVFEPLFGTVPRRPSRRLLVLYGLFCATLAVGGWVMAIGIGSIAIFGVLALGNLLLASRKPIPAPTPGRA
jgi:hypothetical protein